MNDTSRQRLQLCVILYGADGLAGSVSFDASHDKSFDMITNSSTHEVAERIIFSIDDQWWLVLGAARSHRSRLKSGEVISETEHSRHCSVVEGQLCLRLDDFTGGRVELGRFTLLFKLDPPTNERSYVNLP